MELSRIFVIAIGSIFVNNYVLARFLGICPFIGVSKKISTAFGMGIAVIFVMTMASPVTYIGYYFLLKNPFIQEKFGIELIYLKTIVFILVIASLVQLVEILIKKFVPPLYKSLGIFLPLITTNCAVLGVALLNIDKKYTLIESVINGFAAGVGFLVALLLMSGIRVRLESSKIPDFIKGTPIAFIIAGLLSMAFLGFAGMIVE